MSNTYICVNMYLQVDLTVTGKRCYMLKLGLGIFQVSWRANSHWCT